MFRDLWRRDLQSWVYTFSCSSLLLLKISRFPCLFLKSRNSFSYCCTGCRNLCCSGVTISLNWGATHFTYWKPCHQSCAPGCTCTFCSSAKSFQWHTVSKFFIESQRLEVTSGDHLLHPPLLKAGSAKAGCSEGCPVRFWVSPQMQTA